jgi:membrane protease YdiL (CAAX protease family)
MEARVAHFRDRISQNLQTSKLAILCEVVAVLLFAVVILDIGRLAGGGWLFTVIASLVVLLGITGLLLFRHSWWTDYGLTSPKSWFRALGFAVLLVIIIKLLLGFLTAWWIIAAGEPDKSFLDAMLGSKKSLIWILIATWTVGAFGEEMFFRGYLLNRVADLFNRTKIGLTVGLLFSSVVFGFIHFNQGYFGALATFVIGLTLGIAYLRVGFNLWVPIFAHGIHNTIVVLIHYSG